LNGLSGERRGLFRGLLKKRAQTAGTNDTQFRFAERPSESLAAQGWFLIGNLPFVGRFPFRFLHSDAMKAPQRVNEKPISEASRAAGDGAVIKS
jgi:hypothetical protein